MLVTAKIPYSYEQVDYGADSPTRARLLEVNPLGQVPALVLPDGTRRWVRLDLTEAAGGNAWVGNYVLDEAVAVSSCPATCPRQWRVVSLRTRMPSRRLA